ncbi:MAG: hypothetical protein ABT11_20780 [Novosphingobium sp. SCN 66-18]|nr:MAG: hypothetical protein ABT11_20780 [Novosphingobium sp. SCN 66-18]
MPLVFVRLEICSIICNASEMSENRVVIRVFLASPGDLADERRAARAAVEEVNASTAKPQGYQIDLYGWEDTISAAGRPQAIINEELRQCELFIGMLWAKWGTPPDNDGRFTSGFEEEFALAEEMRQNGGGPEMRMYFKAVDEARTKDPGPELTKVLQFRDKLISQKQVLFDNFQDITDFARKLRLGLADYVNRKHRERQTDSQETETPPEVFADQGDGSVPPNEDTQPKIQADFLEAVAQTLREPTPYEAIPASHIARMRLIAMAHYRPGNDDPELGAHDANLLYRERRDFEFDLSEIRTLARFGLGAVSAHNKPLWLWLSSAMQVNRNWLAFETWSSQAAIRKGAFVAAQLVGIDLLTNDMLTREQMVTHWLNQEDRNARKDALGYLKRQGNSEDLPIILEEVANASTETSRELIEAALAINARYDVVSASKLMIQTPFDEIDAALLDNLLKGFSLLEAQDLALAIEHRNGRVRESGLREMFDRGVASAELGRRFADDGYLPVRQIALSIIESHEGLLSNVELEKILVKPKPNGGGGLFGLARTGFDVEGNRAFEQEKFQRVIRQPITHLKSMIETGDVDSDIAYFAMVKRNFPNMSKGLRENFDDRFLAFVAADLDRVRVVIGTSAKALELLEKLKAGESWKRKKYMNQALALLLSRSEPQDLLRVRSAIDDESVEISEELVAYLARHGDWSDISRLAAIAPKSIGERTTLLSLGKTFVDECAIAIYAIARKRLPELAAIELKADLLAKILKLASPREFAVLSDEQISILLLSDNDELRRVTALKVVASIGLNRAKAILETHLSGERYFYNVVHWLDLLVAFPQAKAKQIAIEALRLS